MEIVKNLLDGSDKFLVNLKITPDNRIFVDIDGDNGVNIDDCIEISRAIENSLDRDAEDFELNVSSAGADSPLKFARQYRKNVGRDLEVTRMDGSTVEGLLAEAGDEGFTLSVTGSKRQPAQQITFKYAEILRARVIIKF